MLNLYLAVLLAGFVAGLFVYRKLSTLAAGLGRKEVAVQSAEQAADDAVASASATAANDDDDATLRLAQEVEQLRHVASEERRRRDVLSDDLLATESDLMEAQRDARAKDAALAELSARLDAAQHGDDDAAAACALRTRAADAEAALAACEGALVDAEARARTEAAAREAAEAAEADLRRATPLSALGSLNASATSEEVVALRRELEATTEALEEEKAHRGRYNADLIVSLQRDLSDAARKNGELQATADRLEREAQQSQQRQQAQLQRSVAASFAGGAGPTAAVSAYDGIASCVSSAPSSAPSTPRLSSAAFPLRGGGGEDRQNSITDAERKVAELKKKISSFSRRM